MILPQLGHSETTGSMPSKTCSTSRLPGIDSGVNHILGRSAGVAVLSRSTTGSCCILSVCNTLVGNCGVLAVSKDARCECRYVDRVPRVLLQGRPCGFYDIRPMWSS